MADSFGDRPEPLRTVARWYHHVKYGRTKRLVAIRTVLLIALIIATVWIVKWVD
jgi:hypothetical protein